MAIRQEIAFAKLHAEWEVLLLLRIPGFCWKGNDYGRPNRTQEEGLQRYCASLTGLAKAAPFGYPKQVSLRSCFIAFDEKYKIFEASDRSRLIFSHLLQPLMDALRLEAAAPSPSAEPSSSTTL